MSPRNLIIAGALALALTAGAFVAIKSQAPVSPVAALVLPAPNPVPGFTLLNQQGEAVDQAVFAGQWSLLFFGFTHCPDVCPATLQILASAKKALADKGSESLPQIVLVSVDPERDTPDIMGEYLDYFGQGNLGLTGELAEVRKLSDGLGIFFAKNPGDDGNYSVDHSTAVLVINPDGGFHALFSGPHVIDNYVHDLPIIMGDR